MDAIGSSRKALVAVTIAAVMLGSAATGWTGGGGRGGAPPAPPAPRARRRVQID
jgi:hypothetical protein